MTYAENVELPTNFATDEPPSLTTDKPSSDGLILQPIHYIIIVLMFYMGGLTILIIKYIQSENEEARYQQYYIDFVKRPTFNRPQLIKDLAVSGCQQKESKENVTFDLPTNHTSTIALLPGDTSDELQCEYKQQTRKCKEEKFPLESF